MDARLLAIAEKDRLLQEAESANAPAKATEAPKSKSKRKKKSKSKKEDDAIDPAPPAPGDNVLLPFQDEDHEHTGAVNASVLHPKELPDTLPSDSAISGCQPPRVLDSALMGSEIAPLPEAMSKPVQPQEPSLIHSSNAEHASSSPS
jgi:hypothetical protein